jgi:uncharacterized protein YneF (UPF0154 family)
MSVEGSVRAGASMAGKIYKFLWLVSIIGIIVVLGGFYLEVRKVTTQITEVSNAVKQLQAMVNTMGDKLVSGWQEKSKAAVDKLDALKEQTGKADDLLKKIGK